MSGDMLNNLDVIAGPFPRNSQSSDDKASADTDDMELQACWSRVNQRMRKDIGDAAWRHWIKPLRVSRLKDGTLTLEVRLNARSREGQQPIC